MVDVFLLALISLNVVAVVMESVPSIHRQGAAAFYYFEVFSVMVFSLEYVLRVWSCTTDGRYADGWRGRWRYMRTPLAMVDLLAVLPFYLPAVGVDLRVLRVLRLLRLFRILKLTRYTRSLEVIVNVFRRKRFELSVALSGLVLLLLIAAVLMYHLEHEAQPKAFPDIPSAMWWAAATITTVGYGDVVPTTAPGKLVGVLVAVLGISFFALPTAILGAGFMELLTEQRPVLDTCPHCGKSLKTGTPPKPRGGRQRVRRKSANAQPRK